MCSGVNAMLVQQCQAQLLFLMVALRHQILILLLLAAAAAAMPGCPLTLEQYVYEKLMSKRRHNTTDAAFNEDAEYNANGGHMPQPNTYPADLRQAKKLIGASEWTEHKV